MSNLPLVIVVLGLVAGLAMPQDRHVHTTHTLIAQTMIGAALAIAAGATAFATLPRIAAEE